MVPEDQSLVSGRHRETELAFYAHSSATAGHPVIQAIFPTLLAPFPAMLVWAAPRGAR